MSNSKINFDIPQEVSFVTEKLQNSGFEAFLVGGCVRDLFLNINPKDWDVTTNATPEKIQSLFEHTFYENNFGTVGVVNDKIEEQIKDNEKKISEYRETLEKTNETEKMLLKIQKIVEENVTYETLKVVEVTPYRLESAYSDHRRPDQVKFSQTLEDDLKRRDFSINALCYNPQTREIIDLFEGIIDLQKQEIKAIGNPDDRFKEDALRMLRAVRFVAQLGFTINSKTKESIKKHHFLLKNISTERIRDEFIKILMSKNIIDVFVLMNELDILDYISHDFKKGVGVIQGGGHKYDVFEHLIRSLQYAVDRNWSLEIRLAALFHDIGKSKSARWNMEKNKNTFYGHEVLGEHIVKKNLLRLKFPVKQTEKIVNLVRNHMFFSDPDKITLSAVRRIVRNVGGINNVWDLIKLRICDRIGMGRPKEEPYRLRQYQAMMEEVLRSPISVKDLKISGDDLIKEFHVKPSPKIGMILNALMGITLFEPEKNNKMFLMKQVAEYLNLKEEELIELAERGKNKILLDEEKEIRVLHKKHKIK